MKVNYKWPIVNTHTDIQQQLINTKTGTLVDVSQETVAVGSTAIVFYFLTLSYIYGSALFNEFAKAKHIDTHGSISSILNNFYSKFWKDPMSFFKLNTLSTSFEDSGKIGTTIFVVIFMVLTQALFSSQNIYNTDPKRSTIVAFNYILLLCWLLFMFIFPVKTVKTTSGKKELTSRSHVFLAFCVLLSLIINCWLVSDLYSEYFDEKSIEPLTIIRYVIIASAIFAMLSIMTNGLIGWFSGIIGITGKMVAIAEIVCLLLYGIFMMIFIQFPPVPDARLSCVLVPEIPK